MRGWHACNVRFFTLAVSFAVAVVLPNMCTRAGFLWLVLVSIFMCVSSTDQIYPN